MWHPVYLQHFSMVHKLDVSNLLINIHSKEVDFIDYLSPFIEMDTIEVIRYVLQCIVRRIKGVRLIT
jgi:hypothetical protein